MIDTSAQKTLKNSAYNLIGFVIPIVLLVVVTPVIISHWGAKQYGLYVFLNTFVVFLGFLDLGVSTATSRHIVEYRSSDDDSRLKDMIYSMNSVYLVLAFLYLLTCTGAGYVIQTYFAERVGFDTNYVLIFLILGITAFINVFFSNFSNVLYTLQRNDLLIKIGMVSIILSNLSMLALVLLGFGIIPVLLVQLAISVLTSMIYFFAARGIFPIMRLVYSWKTKEIVRNYKFGLSVAFNSLASSSLVHFDKLLIPVFLGNAQLTYYSVPGSVATKISSVSSTFSSLLFPITVNLHVRNDYEKIRRIYVRSIRLIAILSFSIAASVILMADKILLYWLDETFMRESKNVLVYLVLTNFVLALFSPLTNLLTAMNKMKFLTLGSIAMACINIVALLVLLPRYGIDGAAMAYFISVLFVFWMLRYAEKTYFGITRSGHFVLMLKILATSLPFYAIVHFGLKPLIGSIYTLAIIGPISVFLFMLLYKLFGFAEPDDWNDFKVSFARIFSKLNPGK